MVAQAGIVCLDRAPGPRRRRRILGRAKSGLDPMPAMPDKLISATFAQLRNCANVAMKRFSHFRNSGNVEA